MGYYINYSISLRIPAKYINEALQIFNHLHSDEMLIEYGQGTVLPNIPINQSCWYNDVKTPTKPYTTLFECFNNWSVANKYVSQGIDGKLGDYYMTGLYDGKLRHQRLLFQQLSHVLDDFIVHVYGEDDTCFDWSVKNHVFIEDNEYKPEPITYKLCLRILSRNIPRALRIINHLHSDKMLQHYAWRIHPLNELPIHITHTYGSIKNPQKPFKTLAQAFDHWQLTNFVPDVTHQCQVEPICGIDSKTGDFLIVGCCSSSSGSGSSGSSGSDNSSNAYMNKSPEKFLLRWLVSVIEDAEILIFSDNEVDEWILKNHQLIM